MKEATATGTEQAVAYKSASELLKDEVYAIVGIDRYRSKITDRITAMKNSTPEVLESMKLMKGGVFDAEALRIHINKYIAAASIKANGYDPNDHRFYAQPGQIRGIVKQVKDPEKLFTALANAYATAYQTRIREKDGELVTSMPVSDGKAFTTGMSELAGVEAPYRGPIQDAIYPEEVTAVKGALEDPLTEKVGLHIQSGTLEELVAKIPKKGNPQLN